MKVWKQRWKWIILFSACYCYIYFIAKSKNRSTQMINFDNNTKENMKEHHTNWSETPGHQYRTLIVGSPGSGKTKNALLNLIYHEPDIDKTYLNANDPYDAKNQLITNYAKNRTGSKYSKALTEYSNNM